MLQQEIAEELERERKRNKKELAALKRVNASLMRQKEEAQRVVVHLRSLIDGQAHHMEHIVRSLNRGPEISDFVDDEASSASKDDRNRIETPVRTSSIAGFRRSASRAQSRASTADGRLLDGEDVQPEMERQLFGNFSRDRPYSQLSMADVADRHLQDKTDAIADIIRNISEQCAAAVEGLHLARHVDADVDDNGDDSDAPEEHNDDDNDDADNDERTIAPQHSAAPSESGDPDGERGLLTPHGASSPYPPTPDLVHRSSTSMSLVSQSTTPDRQSQQYTDLPTKIVEDDDEADALADSSVLENGDDQGPNGTIHKHPSASLIRRPAGARISALGQA